MPHLKLFGQEQNPDWNPAAADYAAHRAGPPASFYARLEALGVGKPGQRILDLGTGTGLLARTFARKGVTTAGIDVSDGMIANAKSLAEREGLSVDFRVSPAEQTPFAAASFEAITANHCWWYFDAPKVVAEAKRVLKPGGPVVISFFSWLQIADPVVRETEALILRHSPKANDLGWDGVIPPALSWAKGIATQTAMFWYDEPIPYTHAGWRGRVRANRHIGALLDKQAVERADAELAAILQRTVPDPFTVLHRVSAYFLVPV
ncbi:MAG TPA: class I SAM-dependent methyltransferase [bacterium]